MKNYLINFIGGEFIKLTAEEAARLIPAWIDGAKVLVIHGGAYAGHQIKSIAPAIPQVEKDLCLINGLDPKNPPRIEHFLTPTKQLHA